MGLRDLALAGAVLLDELGFIPAMGTVASLPLRFGSLEKLEAKTQMHETKSKNLNARAQQQNIRTDTKCRA
ncbi:hypothetical protein, partial [Xanthomonas oryzae]|uniref:hypothetical protein n=1 Tax=Xanthomonas oryzae TaxID=347 RepID=UPI001C4BDC26